MKTVVPKVNEKDRKWYLVDADNQVLGRVSSQIATLLRGKHKPEFTPHLDLGDHVIVINVEKIKVTGRKPAQKKYTRYSGYPGGLKTKVMDKMLQKRPDRVLFHAVKGMLPKNRLGRKMIKKLRVYAGPDHPHHSQKPEILPDSLRRI